MECNTGTRLYIRPNRTLTCLPFLLTQPINYRLKKSYMATATIRLHVFTFTKKAKISCYHHKDIRVQNRIEVIQTGDCVPYPRTEGISCSPMLNALWTQWYIV